MKDFKMGQIVQTRGLANAIENNPEAMREVVEAFNKYKGCDWGETCENDKLLNDNAVKNNDERIVAKYHIKSLNKDVFIITEWDRSATTLLFADEY